MNVTANRWRLRVLLGARSHNVVIDLGGDRASLGVTASGGGTAHDCPR
jgi:hypothetical protein